MSKVSSSFLQAIVDGDTESVRDLIKNGVDVNEPYSISGEIPLNLAVYHEKKEITELLLKAKASVNQGNKENLKPLEIAINRCSSTDIGKMLIDYGANINTKDFNGYTMLHVASKRCDLDMVRYLLSRGADVNAKDNSNQTPLHFAFLLLHFGALKKKVVKLLLKNNVDVSAVDYLGRTPLLNTLSIHHFVFTSCKHLFFKFILQFSDVNVADIEGKNIVNINRKSGMVNVILEHIAKLQSLNLPINPVIINSISNDIKYKNYFKQCKEELLAAKNTKLHNSWVTFFNLLIDNKKNLRNYAGNQDMVEHFKNNGCISKFPIYGASMVENFEKGIKRRELFDKSAEFLCDCLPIFNPTHLIIRGVLDDFDKSDLKKICE